MFFNVMPLFFNDVGSPDEIGKEWRDFDFEDRMGERAIGWVERPLIRWVLRFWISWE